MARSNIIFDLDNTLTDYQYTNRHAMSCVYTTLGKQLTDEEYKKFLEFELKYWSKFERSNQKTDTHGMDKIDYVRSKIYQEFFTDDDISLQLGYELMKVYINNLGVKNYVYDGVQETLEYLAEYYNLYIASNGPHDAQERKLANTHLLEYFKCIITAEDAGYAKPKKEFYDYMLKAYDIDPNLSACVGDSLTTDILGANENHMCSIWYNRDGSTNDTDIIPDIVIEDIKELKKIL